MGALFCCSLTSVALSSPWSSSKKQQTLHMYIQTHICRFVLLYALLLLSRLLCSLFISTTSFLANSMNNYRDEHSPCCCLHPKEVVVGVCSLCLKERLLTLASKQGQLPISKDSNKSFRALRRRPAITLPKVFGLGSFLRRLESRRQRPDDGSDESSIVSLEGIAPKLTEFLQCLVYDFGIT